MADPDPSRTCRELLERDGRTYAEEGEVGLRDEPAPLYRLLVLATLASTRIRAEVAAAAARELWAAGFTTPQRMRDSTWQQRVDALGRGGYRRYDESTATALAEGAEVVRDRWDDDVRTVRERCAGSEQLADGLAGGLAETVAEEVQAVPRLGPVGAGIFVREVQAVWRDLEPYLDGRAADAAAAAGLSRQPDRLAAHVPDGSFAALAATLARLGPGGVEAR
ncbi:endonuclease [uncultured Nocardioides sp.]|uniref:endonuclease n=1 Tax=uncultured Nocardioides sp. TaxID=198441 RepID=UPI00261B590D|nr:endonuclease [uncultured Nocardioides sp.]